jgi:hypothetical protein
VAESLLCEAHRQHPADVTVEAEGTGTPFQLCAAAARAMEHCALAPLEWFNLAGLHTASEYLLGPELYGPDGKARQPRRKVKGSSVAPGLDEVRGDLDRLLDYSFSRPEPMEDEAVLEALRDHPANAVLAALSQRLTFFSESPLVEAAAVGVGAAALRGEAAAWLRQTWRKRGASKIRGYAPAFAVSLPPEEAFLLVANELALLAPVERRRETFSLARLRSPAALDWLEANVGAPLTWEWGALAAVSQLSWPRACAWLKAGRPMSLVALDALLDMRGPGPNRTPWMNAVQPRLLAAPPEAEARAVLEAYAAKDPVPRVRKTVAAILERWPEIVR